MKKIVALLLTMLLPVTAALAATPTDLATHTNLGTSSKKDVSAVSVSVSGVVSEINADSLLFTDTSGVHYQVNLTENSVLDVWEHGIGESTLCPGDFVTIDYNGAMTKSIPAQITAERVQCARITGTVDALTEDGFCLLDENDEVGMTFRTDAAMLQRLRDGQVVTVFYNGVVSASLPETANPDFIRLTEMIGMVDEVLEDGSFLFTDEDGTQWQANVGATTAVYVDVVAGQTLRVTSDGTATMSIPAQIGAVEVLPALAEDDV